MKLKVLGQHIVNDTNLCSVHLPCLVSFLCRQSHRFFSDFSGNCYDFGSRDGVLWCGDAGFYGRCVSYNCYNCCPLNLCKVMKEKFNKIN